MTEDHPRNKLKDILLNLAAAALGLAIFLGAIELILRFLPVATGLHTTAVSAESPILRFTANYRFTYSTNWNLRWANRGRVNNAGWVNDQDYDPTARSSLVAVIGDSFIVATHSPYEETVQGRLAACLTDKARVYSFGTSGSPLSQYLAIAEHVRDRYRPTILVVSIVFNDFDESFLRYKQAPGFHYFDETAGSHQLVRKDYEPSRIRRIFRSSALARYMFFNLLLTHKIAPATDPLRTNTPSQPATPTTDASDSVRVRLSRRGVDEFLAQLPHRSGVSAQRTVLVVDGMRPGLYDAESLRAASASFFSVMRNYLTERASLAGFEVVDMQPLFIVRHKKHGVRFETPWDYHWNTNGLAEVARAVRESRALTGEFGPSYCRIH